jgi:hypothetical protein
MYVVDVLPYSASLFPIKLISFLHNDAMSLPTPHLTSMSIRRVANLDRRQVGLPQKQRWRWQA